MKTNYNSKVEKRNMFNEINDILKKNKSIDLSDKNLTFTFDCAKIKINRIYLKTTYLRNSKGQFSHSIFGDGNSFTNVKIDGVYVKYGYNNTFDLNMLWPKNQIKMFRNILVMATENK